jgi:hypothetical protein
MYIKSLLGTTAHKKPSFPDERMRVFTMMRNGVFIMTGFYYIEGSG